MRLRILQGKRWAAVLSAAVVLAGVAPPAAAQARVPATAASVTGQLESVSCAGRGDCWAVGSTGGVTSGHAIVEHWNGSAWQVVLSENPPGAKTSYLGGVSCANATNCWAVGSITTASMERWQPPFRTPSNGTARPGRP